VRKFTKDDEANSEVSKKNAEKKNLMGSSRECWLSESSVGIVISQLVGILWLFEVFFTGGEFRGWWW
jgi:hypothetical protein